MTHLAPIKDREIYAVPIKPGWKNFSIEPNGLGFNDRFKRGYTIPIKFVGEHRILFATPCTEQEAASVVDGKWPEYFENCNHKIWKDYSDGIYRLDTALESLHSLLRACGCDGTNYLLIERIK